MADSRLSQSITTLLIGMIVSIIAFLILGFTEGLFHDQNVIRWLPTLKSEDLVRESGGLVKLYGLPEAKTELKVPEYDQNLLFLKRIYQEKVDDKWVTVRTDQAWANFDILGVAVHPESAVQYLNLEQKYLKETDNERQAIFGFDADEPIIVVGENINGVIRGGDSFAISNKSNSVLESELKASIHFDWWLYKLLAVFLLSLGLMAGLLPLLDFFELIKELGTWGILSFIGASIATSFILVAIETIIFAYWFLISLVILFIGYMFVKIFIKKKRKPINILN